MLGAYILLRWRGFALTDLYHVFKSVSCSRKKKNWRTKKQKLRSKKWIICLNLKNKQNQTVAKIAIWFSIPLQFCTFPPNLQLTPNTIKMVKLVNSSQAMQWGYQNRVSLLASFITVLIAFKLTFRWILYDSYKGVFHRPWNGEIRSRRYSGIRNERQGQITSCTRSSTQSESKLCFGNLQTRKFGHHHRKGRSVFWLQASSYRKLEKQQQKHQTGPS